MEQVHAFSLSGFSFLLQLAISYRKGGEISIVFDSEEALGVASRPVPTASRGAVGTLYKGKEL